MNRRHDWDRVAALDRRTRQDANHLWFYIVALVIIVSILIVWCLRLQDRVDRLDHVVSSPTTQPLP